MAKKTVSAIMMFLLVLGTLCLACKIQPVKADCGTIYIRADGSIDPATAPLVTADNVTYFLTGSINCSIAVEKSGIVINGSGYSLQGSGSGDGIFSTTTLTDIVLTIDNIQIQGFNAGISVWVGEGSASCSVSQCNITNNGVGTEVWSSDYTSCSVSQSNVTNNGVGTEVGSGMSCSCSVSQCNITNNGVGTEVGVGIEARSMRTGFDISANTIANNSGDGIYLGDCGGQISGNNIINNGGDGIRAIEASCNASKNNVTGNGGDGINLGGGVGGEIYENNVINNKGTGIIVGAGNKVFHNNFEANGNQASTTGHNTWDNGYPSGGNYWSDYNGPDSYSGPYQNITGGDGIGDTPYIIPDVYPGNNSDNYPFMKPYPSVGVHDVAVTNVACSRTVVGQGLSANINVTVANQGNFAETFNLTVHANTTSIASQNVTLSSGSSTTVPFTLNTTGFTLGNYVLSAYACPVPGETDTANNNCSGGWVIVSLVGDLTGTTPGVPNGKVDIRDIAFVAKDFGSTPGSPNWNANCDVNNDGKIDIKDINVIARYFGNTDP